MAPTAFNWDEVREAYRRTGWWFPLWTDVAQTEIKALVYHCLHCQVSYKFIGPISERCPLCRNLIDFTDLRELTHRLRGRL